MPFNVHVQSRCLVVFLFLLHVITDIKISKIKYTVCDFNHLYT